MNDKPKGPYTLWFDYGYEGWKPTDFATLKEALEADRYTHDWVITKSVAYDVVDTSPDDTV